MFFCLLEAIHAGVVLPPDPSTKWEEVWCSEWHFLSHGVGPKCKECHNCIWHPTKLSDGLDCYTVWFTKAQKDSNISWDSGEQAVRQVCSTSNSQFNKRCLHHAHIFTHSAIWFSPTQWWQEKSLRTPDPLSRKRASWHEADAGVVLGLRLRLYSALVWVWDWDYILHWFGYETEIMFCSGFGLRLRLHSAVVWVWDWDYILQWFGSETEITFCSGLGLRLRLHSVWGCFGLRLRLHSIWGGLGLRLRLHLPLNVRLGSEATWIDVQFIRNY